MTPKFDKIRKICDDRLNNDVPFNFCNTTKCVICSKRLYNLYENNPMSTLGLTFEQFRYLFGRGAATKYRNTPRQRNMKYHLKRIRTWCTREESRLKNSEGEGNPAPR
jgi:hypothetical protein